MQDSRASAATSSVSSPAKPPVIESELFRPAAQRTAWKTWVIVGGIVGGGAFVILTCASLMFPLMYLASGRGQMWQLTGRWIHVDQPPSLAAEALMSVGNKVISDEEYIFTPYGSVTHNHYSRGATKPYSKVRGTWSIATDQNGDEGETAIMLDFRDQRPVLMYVRFGDHRNAEFRMNYGSPDYFYKPH